MRPEDEVRYLFKNLQSHPVCNYPPFELGSTSGKYDMVHQVAVRAQLDLLAWLLEAEPPAHPTMYGDEPKRQLSDGARDEA